MVTHALISTNVTWDWIDATMIFVKTQLVPMFVVALRATILVLMDTSALVSCTIIVHSLLLTVHHCMHATLYSDINECSEGTGRCAHNCHNTLGHYGCSCNVGFWLSLDGYSCIGRKYA